MLRDLPNGTGVEPRATAGNFIRLRSSNFPLPGAEWRSRPKALQFLLLAAQSRSWGPKEIKMETVAKSCYWVTGNAIQQFRNTSTT